MNWTVRSQRVFIRSNRDWLYRTRLAWEGILRQWRPPPQQLDDMSWGLITRTYRFLAPRFMPVQEWQLLNTTHGAKLRKTENVMHW